MLHLQTISTISLPLPILTPGQLSSLESWLRSLLWDVRLPDPDLDSNLDPSVPSFSIHRTKGRVILTDGSVKMIQGVREVFEIVETDGDGAASADLKAKIVFIGRGLESEGFGRSLELHLRQGV